MEKTVVVRWTHVTILRKSFYSAGSPPTLVERSDIFPTLGELREIFGEVDDFVGKPSSRLR